MLWVEISTEGWLQPGGQTYPTTSKSFLILVINISMSKQEIQLTAHSNNTKNVQKSLLCIILLLRIKPEVLVYVINL